MKDKILCPWCGSRMSRYTKHEHRLCQLYFASCYICGQCGATSPRHDRTDRERAKELAKEAALKRFKPLQKPLTAEEIGGTIYMRPCWIERIIYRLAEEDEPIAVIEPDVLDMDSGGYYGKINIATLREVPYMYLSQYNKTWRCWATKPTEEERQAAEWQSTK